MVGVQDTCRVVEDRIGRGYRRVFVGICTSTKLNEE
jgi:hypothetical protein